MWSLFLAFFALQNGWRVETDRRTRMHLHVLLCTETKVGKAIAGRHVAYRG